MTHYADLYDNYTKLLYILKTFNSHKALSSYSTHPKYGFVNTRIQDLGCALSVSMVICIPLTYDEGNEDLITELQTKFNITIVKNFTIREKKTYMIYSNNQFGITERTKIENVWETVRMLISHEQTLEAK
jgi:hypothetical protein